MFQVLLLQDLVSAAVGLGYQINPRPCLYFGFFFREIMSVSEHVDKTVLGMGLVKEYYLMMTPCLLGFLLDLKCKNSRRVDWTTLTQLITNPDSISLKFYILFSIVHYSLKIRNYPWGTNE